MSTIASPQYYVYILARPNGKPFYVGKGQGNRVYSHEREAKRGCDCRKCRTIRKIWQMGGEVQRYTVFTTDDEHEALAFEVELIALYGRKTLVNHTDGGDGTSGYKHTAEYREKVRTTVTAYFAANPEAREVSRIAARNAWATQEYRAKRQATVSDPEYQAKISETLKKAPKAIAHRLANAANPDVREKRRISVRMAWSDPDLRSEQSNRLKEHLADPEARAKWSAAQKERWSDPAKRAEQSKRMKEVLARKRQAKEKS